MYRIAFKMLIGDRGKYFGILMGLTFASLLITQQASIFVGLMTRTYAITDIAQPDIWVMDPKVQFIDDVKPLQDTELHRVRGVAGRRVGRAALQGPPQGPPRRTATSRSCNVSASTTPR